MSSPKYQIESSSDAPRSARLTIGSRSSKLNYCSEEKNSSADGAASVSSSAAKAVKDVAEDKTRSVLNTEQIDFFHIFFCIAKYSLLSKLFDIIVPKYC